MSSFDTAFGIFSLAGLLSICLALIVMGILSRRLGKVTQARPYHRGFYIAAALVFAGVIFRMIHLINGVAEVADLTQNTTIWILMTNGIPAIGLTLGLVVAWRYWSWLLAERD